MKRKIIYSICIAFFIILLIIGVILFYDLKNYKSKEKPLFVIMEKVHNYSDGYVYEYYTFGYKIINYQRESINKFDISFWYQKLEE